jgi:hypothetical protein
MKTTMMKNTLAFRVMAGIALITILLFSACKKDSEPSSPGDDTPPVILLDGKDIYEDTLKFSVNPEIEFSFTIEDDLSGHTLSMSKLDDAIVYYDGSVLNNAAVDINTKSGNLQFRALEVGVHSFFLTIEDEAARSNTVLIEITALGNLQPRAVLTAEQIDETAPYHVRVDASQSFDEDAQWGGAITAYEFDLEGFYQVETARGELDYIYPEPGNYTITLRVKDNDGAWSGEEKVVVNVTD